MNLDKDFFQRWSPVISFCYVPFHDDLFLGDLLPHGIVDGFYAGVAGAAVSFAANKVYNLVQEIKIFSKLLKFQTNQNWLYTAVQLGARLVVHVVVGAAMGFGLSLLMPSAGATATAGFAVGFAAFVGSQLLRLIYKVTAFVLSKIGSGIASVFEWLVNNSVVQEMVIEQSVKEDEEKAKTEATLYKAMGLDTASTSAGLKTVYTSTSSYKNVVTNSISIGIMSHQQMQDNVIFNKCVINDEYCGRLFDAVNTMGELIREHRLEHKYVNPNLVTRLAWQVSFAIMNDEPTYVKNFIYNQGMFDPFRFNYAIKISDSDAQLINQIYNIVRKFVKEKPLPNPSIPLETKNQFSDVIKKSLIDKLKIMACLNAVFVKTKKEAEDKRKKAVVEFIDAHILLFNGNNLECVQSYDINGSYEIFHENQSTKLEQDEVLFINEKLNFARNLFNMKDSFFNKYWKISEWIYSKYSTNLCAINFKMMYQLHNVIIDVIAYKDFNSSIIDRLNPISHPYQFNAQDNVLCPNYSCTKEEVNFINEVFSYAKQNL